MSHLSSQQHRYPPGTHQRCCLFLLSLSLLPLCLPFGVSLLILSSQQLDFAMLVMSKYSCALEFYPKFHFMCIHANDTPDSITPFGDDIFLMSGNEKSVGGEERRELKFCC